MSLLTIPGPIAHFNHFNNELNQLQGNILKGHGRDHAGHAFIVFKPGKVAKARAWLRSLPQQHRITTARKQLDDAKAFRQTGEDGGSFVIVFLTAEGYRYFGKDTDAFLPTDTGRKFIDGMRASQANLDDPLEADWDPKLQKTVHAMMLMADDHPATVQFMARSLAIETADFADFDVVTGNQRRNDIGEGIEHFGYVDGRSQLIFIEEDLARESDGVTVFDPAAPPSHVLVKDPFGDADGLGSYFVFRMLEEDVKGFKSQEQSLANALNLVGDAREVAGAYAIGRFEDGTPVLLSDEPMIEGGGVANRGAVPNNFDYRLDPNGSRCPMHAHIRKINPRGSNFGPDESRAAQMARRGITYGDRDDDGSDLDLMPEKDVGLLFMSYQADISKQFEVMQRFWANNPGFPVAGTGVDPVIGQVNGPAQNWPTNWGDAGTTPFLFQDFVHLKGGDYFFAPSLSGLRNI